MPRGVTIRVEQARQDMQGRNIEIQVVNGSDEEVTVDHAELTSGRFDEPAVYRGPATIPEGATTNLTLPMSRARCGTGIDATATITYRVGNGEQRVSTVRPTDHYGSVALAMKRDCAESIAPKVVIDDTFTVQGTGAGSVLEVAMTFTPRAKGDPVGLGPLGGTTLLKPRPGSNIDHVLEPGGAPYRVVVEIIPNRCDAHVVAEDRTGAIMPLHVDSRSSGRAFFYLHFTEAQRRQVFDFIARHCGFGKVPDPLMAP